MADKPAPKTVETEPESDETETIDGEDQLGDAGKRALDRMKSELKQTKRELAKAMEENNSYKREQFSNKLVQQAQNVLADPSLAPALLSSLDATSDENTIKEALNNLVKEHPVLGVKPSAPDPFEALSETKPEVPNMQPLPPDAINAATFGAQLEQLGIKTN